MLRRITLIAASVAALSLSAHAFAITAQSGVYVGAVGGWTFAKNPTTSSVAADYIAAGGTAGSTATDSNKNYTFGANLGYDYALNSSWLVGAEVGYINFGKTSYTISDPDTGNTNIDLKEYGYQFLATGTYLMSNGFNAFAKAGAINQKETQDDSNSFNSASESTTKWLPATAIGVGYMPMQNLNVALQWEHTFGDNETDATQDNSTKPQTQDAVTLGVTYKFAM